MPLKSVGAIALLLTSAGYAPSAVASNCSTMLEAKSGDAPQGTVTPEKLLALRDIGSRYPARGRDLFSISPDMRFVAFQLHQADPGQNAYCVALVVVELVPGATPRILDVGGQLLLDGMPKYGWANFPLGEAATITPRWSPDGKWIAYRKTAKGKTQVWIAKLDRAGAAQVTGSASGVEDFKISADGQSIIYSSRPGLAESDATLEEEGLRGWRYDERALPVRGPRPQIRDTPKRVMVADVLTLAERAATESEIALLQDNGPSPNDKMFLAMATSGSEVWGQPESTGLFPPFFRLVARDQNGVKPCSYDTCEVDMSASIWWAGDGKRVLFTRREGWADSLTAIYEWTPNREGAPRRIVLTDDVLINCQVALNDLLCLREGSLRPRHFVKIDSASGKEQRLYDPNIEFGRYKLGRVERLNWRNNYNVKFYGDLVYPTDYRTGNRYPLVVVQYRSRGFLRGGIGDEVPIQTFAARGYFVLVVDNLNHLSIVGRQPSAQAWSEAFNHDFAGRRNIVSAIEVAVRSLIDQGLVKPKNVGITGLSDGASTVQFAALNSDVFSAASVGSCCWEPLQDVFLGPAIAAGYHDGGWPRLIDEADELWSHISLVRQPQNAKFPILFQVADNEYLATLASYTALQQAKIPSDLFVFPNEEHVKWQPTHRLAVYRRNLAWFDFWLKDQSPSDPIGSLEVARWAKMKKAWKEVSSLNKSIETSTKTSE